MRIFESPVLRSYISRGQTITSEVNAANPCPAYVDPSARRSRMLPMRGSLRVERIPRGSGGARTAGRPAGLG